MKRLSVGVAILVLLLASLSACSVGRGTSRIAININQLLARKSALNTANFQPFLVVLQISGEGMAGPTRISLNCENSHQCDSLSQEVPEGRKLIQLVLVANNDGEREVYFSGQEYQLGSGDQNLSIALGKIATSNAEFSGRYIPTNAHVLAGRKLTGRVGVVLKPSGQLPVLVDGMEIHAGFFTSFLFTDLTSAGYSLIYRFNGWTESGTRVTAPIFNDIAPLGLIDGSGPFTTVSDKSLISVKVPEHFEQNGDGTLEREAERRFWLGFLGQATATKQVCWDDVSGFVYDGISASETLCHDPTCTNFLNWPAGLASGNGSDPAGITFASAAGNQPVQCSSLSGPPANPDSIFYDTALAINRDYITDDSFVFGFSGPFRASSLAGVWDFAHINGPQIIFAGFADLPTGASFAAFGANGVERDNYRDDEHHGFDCNKIAQDFSPLAITTSAGSLQHSIDLSHQNPLDFHLAICLKDPAGQYFAHALYEENLSPGSNGPGNGGDLAFSLLNVADGSVTSASVLHYEFPPTAAVSESHTVYIRIENVSGQQVDLDVSQAFHINGLQSGEFEIQYIGNGYLSGDAGLAGAGICNDGTVLPAGNFCHIKVVFDPSLGGILQGSTLHTGLSVNYQIAGQPSGAGMGLTGPVYLEMLLTAVAPVTTHLTADVAKGEYDVKFVKLINDTGNVVTADDPAIINPGFASVDYSSCVNIPVAGFCYLRFEYNGSHVAAAANENSQSWTQTFSGVSPPPSQTWDYETHSGDHMLTWNHGPLLDFGSVAPLAMPTNSVILTNQSQSLAINNIQRHIPAILPFSFSDVASGQCNDAGNNYNLATLTSCTLDLTVDNTAALDQEFFESLFIYYEMGGTYRDFYGFVQADLQ